MRCCGKPYAKGSKIKSLKYVLEIFLKCTVPSIFWCNWQTNHFYESKNGKQTKITPGAALFATPIKRSFSTPEDKFTMHSFFLANFALSDIHIKFFALLLAAIPDGSSSMMPEKLSSSLHHGQPPFPVPPTASHPLCQHLSLRGVKLLHQWIKSPTITVSTSLPTIRLKVSWGTRNENITQHAENGTWQTCIRTA